MSGVSGCGSPTFPGVYFKVARVASWIRDTVGVPVNTPAIRWKGRVGSQRVFMPSIETNVITTRPWASQASQSPEVVFQIDPNLSQGAARDSCLGGIVTQ